MCVCVSSSNRDMPSADLTQPGPALMGGSGISNFKKISSVIPHKALVMILYLNFEKIVQDLAEQNARKNVIRFGLV